MYVSVMVTISLININQQQYIWGGWQGQQGQKKGRWSDRVVYRRWWQWKRAQNTPDMLFGPLIGLFFYFYFSCFMILIHVFFLYVGHNVLKTQWGRLGKAATTKMGPRVWHHFCPRYVCLFFISCFIITDYSLLHIWVLAYKICDRVG